MLCGTLITKMSAYGLSNDACKLKSRYLYRWIPNGKNINITNVLEINIQRYSSRFLTCANPIQCLHE